MKVHSFFNNKGGVGKTTLSLLISGGLISKGKSVCIIDTDPQGNASKQLCNNQNRTYELVDYLKVCIEPLNRKTEIKDVVYETDYENLFVVPTFTNSEMQDFINARSGTTDYMEVAEIILDDLKENFNFDFVLIDMPPSTSELTKKFIKVADEITPVLELDDYSIDGFESLINLVMKLRGRKSKPIIKSVIFNKEDKRAKIQALLKKSIINENLPLKPFVFPTEPAIAIAKHTYRLPTNFDLKKETQTVLESLVTEFIGEEQ